MIYGACLSRVFSKWKPTPKISLRFSQFQALIHVGVLSLFREITDPMGDVFCLVYRERNKTRQNPKRFWGATIFKKRIARFKIKYTPATKDWRILNFCTSIFDSVSQIGQDFWLLYSVRALRYAKKKRDLHSKAHVTVNRPYVQNTWKLNARFRLADCYSAGSKKCYLDYVKGDRQLLDSQVRFSFSFNVRLWVLIGYTNLALTDVTTVPTVTFSRMWIGP